LQNRGHQDTQQEVDLDPIGLSKTPTIPPVTFPMQSCWAMRAAMPA